MPTAEAFWNSIDAIDTSALQTDEPTPTMLLALFARLVGAVRDNATEAQQIHLGNVGTSFAASKRDQEAALNGGLIGRLGGKRDLAGFVALCALIAVLDDRVADFTDKLRASRNPARDFRIAGTDIWVVPRVGLRSSRATSFQHRVLRRHHVVHAKPDAHAIRWLESSESHSNPPIAFGIAAFPELQPIPVKTADAFHIIDLDCPAQEQHLDEQLAALAAGPLLAALWPELTMPEAAVDRLRAALRNSKAVTPSLVVAGSWHIEVDGTRRNRAPIFDARGVALGFHDKFRKFDWHEPKTKTNPVETTRAEAIAVDDLPCLTLGYVNGYVFAIAICRDFCDLGAANLYSGLDVDFILVPSLGKAITLDGTIETAKLAALITKSRTVTAFQSLEPGVANAGLLLPEAAAAPQSAFERHQNWTTRTLDVKPAPT